MCARVRARACERSERGCVRACVRVRASGASGASVRASGASEPHRACREAARSSFLSDRTIHLTCYNLPIFYFLFSSIIFLYPSSLLVFYPLQKKFTSTPRGVVLTGVVVVVVLFLFFFFFSCSLF